MGTASKEDFREAMTKKKSNTSPVPFKKIQQEDYSPMLLVWNLHVLIHLEDKINSQLKKTKSSDFF